MFLNFFAKNNKIHNISTCVSKIKLTYNKGKCYVCNSMDHLSPLISDYSICFCEKCKIKVLVYEYVDLTTYNDIIEMQLNLKNKNTIKNEEENENKKQTLDNFFNAEV